MLDVVTREVEIPARPEAVWAAITDGEQVARWFGDSARIDLRVGGAVRYTWPAGEVATGVVTAVEPLRRFVFRWDVFGTITDPGLFTTVAFALRPIADGTAVRVTESGLRALVDAGVAAELEDLVEEHIDGWRNEMSDLARYLQARFRTPPQERTTPAHPAQAPKVADVRSVADADAPRASRSSGRV